MAVSCIISKINVRYSQKIDFYHTMLHVVSVCPSVCLSRSWTLSKWINISSKSFYRRVATHIIWTKRHGNIPTESNAGMVSKNRDSQRISGYRIDDWCSANNNCDRQPFSLPHRPPRISDLVYHNQHGRPRWKEEKRTEYTCTQHGKSEANVTNNRRLHSTYCTTELSYVT